ncbi:MAG TPA: adenosylcobalamin biosynthesis, GlcG-related protein [Gammaproteobacteria bacterium]|nr:adenosylcobalamin biosynthesis, GlcG-related protein [Gammaproteobacteria bacterium]
MIRFARPISSALIKTIEFRHGVYKLTDICTTEELPVKASIVAALAALITTPTLAEDDAPMITPIQRITMETAQTIAKAAIDACRKQGISAGVTVVDRNGIAQAVLRDTLAPPVTLPVSQKKAYTAANFNAATSTLENRAQTALGNMPQMMLGAGGLPIQAGGSMLGGVGVSGAPSGETDEVCAQAGLDAVVDDLEMGM